MKKQKHKRSKNMKGIIMLLCPLIAIYLGVSAYFMNHFYFGSKINGINVAGKTVKQADELISSAIDTYILDLEERGDVKEQIKGVDIGLSYDPKDKIKDLKDKQNPLLWVTSFFNQGNTTLDHIVNFDENLLNEQLNKLSCFTNSNITEPKSASFEYAENGYKILDEINGNKVKKDVLHENVLNSIFMGDKILKLDEKDCYENPKYTIKSKEVTAAKDILDKYTSVKVTYTFGDKKEVVDGSKISKWLEVNDNMEVTFNEKDVKKYVDSLAREYNTFSKNRKFATSSGKTVQVIGGNYGWIIDKPGYVKDIIEAIKQGQDVTKEPIYSQTAISRDENDIGNTYIELDLKKQHVWFYKNGSLIVEGDVVTGNSSNNAATPVGVYRLTYKEKNATLKGENYSAPVNYWLPFNGNIGLHDASWRTEFGGQIYTNNGSHGCVNAPLELASKIFDNIEAGTPVVCYYEE